MANAFGAQQLYGVANALRAAKLARVSSDVQASVTRFAINPGKEIRRAACLVSTNSKSNHAKRTKARCPSEHLASVFQSEMANCIKDPPHANAPPGLGAGGCLTDCLENGLHRLL